MGLLNKLKPGLDENSGLVPQFLRNLFTTLAQNDHKTEILLSFFQIYCDEVRDLLNPEAKGLVIREKKDSGETFIRDLVETPVGNLEEAFKIVNAGLVFRKMGSQVNFWAVFFGEFSSCFIRKWIRHHQEATLYLQFTKNTGKTPQWSNPRSLSSI